MPILSVSRRLPQHQLLLRLFWMRCIATLAQALLVAAAHAGMQLDLPLQPLAAVLALLLLANVLTWWRMRLARPARDIELFFQLCVDVSALSALLYFSGGATNPFVSFYLPALAVAAAILPSRYAFLLALYSLACYAGLTVWYRPLPIHDHDQATVYHLAGMLVNFAMSAALITWFVTRMSATVRERDAQLAQARELQLLDERIVALGTQAASAAHDMSTPLATIAVIVGELRHDTARCDALAPYRDELALVETQIGVCKSALDRMGMHAGRLDAVSAASVGLSEWLRQYVDAWRLRHPALSIRLSLQSDGAAVRHHASIGQILQALLDNAAQAVAAQGEIEVALRQQHNTAVIRVTDDGPGIAAPLRKRLGYEPVRSSTGGKGIGLMLAFATARQIGARLTLSGDAGRGTSATLTITL